MKEDTFRKYKKILGSKIVQVKGLMPPKDGLSRKHPPAEPLGEMWYGLTFPATQKFVMLWDNFIGISI